MPSLVQRSDVSEFRKKFRWLVLFIVVAFTVLIGRLFVLQLVRGDIHDAQARRNIIGERRLATTRGVIRDSQGKVLAANRPAYNVHVVCDGPEGIDMEATWPRLVSLMRLSGDEAETIKQKILKIKEKGGNRATQQTLIKVDVSRDVVAALETHAEELRGVDVTPAPVRYYPEGELGAHLIGYMREVDAETLAQRPEDNYRAGDSFGAVGVEKRWESYLKGQRGWRRFIRKSPRRDTIEGLEERYLGENRRQEPVPGRDISLSLDIDLVRSAEDALRGQLAGAVVVVDVRTGRLLAALSKPSFDPNIVSGGSGKAAVGEAFRRYYADPLKPTLDKTISAAYPPGSTYKPFSALAGLSEGLITPDSQVDCRGGYEYGKRFFRCTGVHRRVNLHSAIVQSCNSYFYDLGSRIDIDRLAEIGMNFGFGAMTGIGVNPEARGRMPTRGWYTRRYKGAFRGGFALLAAIGQGATTVNVLQLALSYAALANGGTLYRPQVVRSIETSDGTVVQDFPPRVRRMIELDPARLELIRGGLVGVVKEEKGTGHHERIEGVDLAGKTGTAQVSHVTPHGVDPNSVWYFNRDHAWFAGFAPSQSPEIAIVVIVEHGGGGGKNAVPVAMRVVRDWQKLKAERLAAHEKEKEK
jgi:penicillin-binding protein 2